MQLRAPTIHLLARLVISARRSGSAFGAGFAGPDGVSTGLARFLLDIFKEGEKYFALVRAFGFLTRRNPLNRMYVVRYKFEITGMYR